MNTTIFRTAILAVFFSFIGMASFGQGFMLNGLTTNSNALTECDSSTTIAIAALTADSNSTADFNLALLGTSFQSSQFTVTINWGDGSTTTHVGGTSNSGQAISFNPPIEHFYNNTGNYTILVNVLNPQNGTTASDSLFYNQTVCNVFLFSQVMLDCDANGSTDSVISNGVIIDLIGQNGGYASGALNGGSITYFNLQEGTYTINVNANWLAQNGYSAGPITPPTITISPNMSTFTSLIILYCDSVSPSNNLCLSGLVYCDTDSNGVYSAGDTPINNAPVQIMNGGLSYLTYTNPNGYYVIDYSGTVGSATIISINPNWLAQNGYTMTSNPYTVLAADCNNQPTANLAINCNGGYANPTYCFAAIVFCDANGNSIFDNNELPLEGAPITLWIQNQSITIYSDSNGYASYCGNNFNSNVVIGQISQAWLTQHGYLSPNPTVTLFSNGTSTPNPGYFTINCGGSPNTCADLWTTVTPWIGYYQGTTNYIHLNYGNYGPGSPGPYTLTLTYPAGVTPNLSSINNPNYTISGNTITWTLNSNLTNFSYSDIISFNVPGGIANGTVHQFTSTITPTGNITDCCTSNNNGCLVQIVGSSYDPNDKNVDHAEQIAPAVQDELTYTIRFQNTGTAPAQNIYILDTLSANLDWTTFELIQASHAMHVENLGNGVLSFNFPQIWLPDSTTNEVESHGQLVYRIKENGGNTEGSTIYNTAYIFFDWNDPIVTNTTYNINTTLGINESMMNSTVYPNPFQSNLTIRSATQLEEVRLFDLSGKELLQLPVAALEVELDLQQFANGVYILQLQTASGISTHQVVKK